MNFRRKDTQDKWCKLGQVVAVHRCFLTENNVMCKLGLEEADDRCFF